MTLIGLIIILLASFYVMGKIVDEYFISSLDAIAKRTNMSSDAAGATLMAAGSSAPELFIAAIAILKPGGHEAIGMGTIVGSAIFNVLVIVGAAAVVKFSKFAWQPVVRDLSFYSLSIILLIFAFQDQTISMAEGIIFVLFYGVYVFVVMKWRKWLPYQEPEYEEHKEEQQTKPKSLIDYITLPADWTLDKMFRHEKYFVFNFIVSIILIAILSWVLVESAVEISHILQIPEAIIALTVLAVGTSVPDLMSSIIVAKQGRGGMAISNAFGSNIFDILIGLGLPWLITILFTGSIITVEAKNLFTSSIILFGTVMVVFVLFSAQKWSAGRKTGLFLISLYVAYVIWELYRM